MSNLIFKGFEPFRDLIDGVNDERSYAQGIWVELKEPSETAAGICAPLTLHEETVKELVAQLRLIRDARIKGDDLYDDPLNIPTVAPDPRKAVQFYLGDAVVSPGDTIKTDSGETWVYQGVASAPSPGKSGKVLVGDPDFDPDVDAGINERVFYPQVFNGEIR